MPIDLNNIYAGYTKASTYNRVDKNTLLKALRPYAINLKSTAGKSDVQLRHMAAQAVVKRYRAKKKV